MSLSYFGQLSRDHDCQITKTVVEVHVDRRRRRGETVRGRWKEIVSQVMAANDQT